MVPVYNSELSLQELVAGVDRFVRPLAAGFELVCVDDGSSDGSWAVLESLMDQHDWITGIRLNRNFGQHNALLAGVRAAHGEAIVTMDDDLQHPAEEVEKLLAALDPDVDLVYGYPEREEHGKVRTAASQMVKLSLSATLRAPEARRVSAFRAFRSSLLAGFNGNVDPGVNLDVLLAWTTTRVRALPVRVEARRYGRSNYTVRRLVRHALNMITGYSTIPLRIVTYLGIVFTVFGSLVLAYVLGHYMLYGGQVPGFTFVAALVALFSGAQTFALGVFGEYLGRMHMRSMHQPQYLLREIRSGATDGGLPGPRSGGPTEHRRDDDASLSFASPSRTPAASLRTALVASSRGRDARPPADQA